MRVSAVLQERAWHNYLSRIVLVVIFFFTGCSAAEKIVLPSEPYAIIIRAPKLLLESREIVSLNATVVSSTGAPVGEQAVIWTSSNDAIASVSANGVVSAGTIRGGATEWVTIRAVSSTVVSEVALGIKPSAVARVKVVNRSLEIISGDTVRFGIEVYDSSGTALFNRPVIWSVSDSLIGSVTASGVFSAVDSGRAVIRAAVFSISDSLSINVTRAVLPRSMPATISSGPGHTCAVRVDNALLCWGANGSGQIGVGFSSAVQDEPIGVLASNVFTQVSVGFSTQQSEGTYLNFSCALSVDREAWCWGFNDAGSVGDGTKTTRFTPTRVAGGLRFTKLSSDYRTTCGITDSGRVFCWGGIVPGMGSPWSGSDSAFVPLMVQSAEVFKDISVRFGHACALNVAGRAFCWGENYAGQIGDGTYIYRSSPTAVLTDISFSSIVTGLEFSCGISLQARVLCWGEGAYRDVSTLGSRLIPVVVSENLRFSSLSAGLHHICGIARTGRAFCWGQGGNGQLGGGASSLRNSPFPVSSDRVFVAISAGYSHTCGIADDGAAFCWGSNFNGEGGNRVIASGSWFDRNVFVPTPVSGLHKFRTN